MEYNVRGTPVFYCKKCGCTENFSVVVVVKGIALHCEACEDYIKLIECRLSVHDILDKEHEENEKSEIKHQHHSFDWVFNN